MDVGCFLMEEDWQEKREKSESDKGIHLFCIFCTHRHVDAHRSQQQLCASTALYSWCGEQISAWGSGLYGGSRRKERNDGEKRSKKKKRTRYLKYYTYQGKCSVEQALWECKLHSPLLPSGCRLLDDYNHPQHWAPRTTHCSIHRHRIAECWIECHDVCMFIKKYWSGTWILACSTGEIM